MKRIIELDSRMEHPDDEANAEQRAAMPTLRRLLKMVAIGVAPAGVDESDIYYQVGLKLRMKETAVDLEDAEFNLVMKKVEANALNWTAPVHHFVLEALRQAKDKKIDPVPGGADK